MMKSHLEEAAQSFIEDHLNSFNLLRKNIWEEKEKDFMN